MKTTPRIGNDVVDLDLPYNKGKYADRRFISRVFTEAEQSAIIESNHPDLMLWALWAAKETAYKITRKIDPGFVFAHQSIEADPAPLQALSEGDQGGTVDSAVRVDGSIYAIRWVWTGQYVNCIGINEHHCKTMHDICSAVRSVDDELFSSLSRAALSQRELSSCFSEESTLVRLLAKHVMEERGIRNAEVLRKRVNNRLSPPELILNGSSAEGMDISLSHDGKWISVALLF